MPFRRFQGLIAENVAVQLQVLNHAQREAVLRIVRRQPPRPFADPVVEFRTWLEGMSEINRNDTYSLVQNVILSAPSLKQDRTIRSSLGNSFRRFPVRLCVSPCSISSTPPGSSSFSCIPASPHRSAAYTAPPLLRSGPLTVD